MDIEMRAAKPAIFVFLLALLLRLALLAVLYGVPSFFDPQYVTDHWDHLSRNILAGKGFSWVEDGSVPTVSRAPMYALFLAVLIKLTSGNLLLIRILYLVLDAFTAVLVYKLAGRMVKSEAASLFAALFYAIFLFPAWHACKLAPDAFFSFVFLVAVIVLIGLLRACRAGGGTAAQAVLAGLLLGIAILTKKTVLLLPPAVFMLMAARGGWSGRSLRNAVLFLLVCGVTLGPWVYRNYRVTGRIGVLQTLTWFNYWYGEFMDENSGRFDMAEAQRKAAEYIAGLSDIDAYLPYGLPPRLDIERENKLRALALENIARSPGHFLGKTLRNVARFWYLTETERILAFTKLVGAILFILFAAGVFVAARSGDVAGDYPILIAVVLYFNLIYAPVFSIMRYMIPVLPYVAFFAGLALAALWRKAARQHVLWRLGVADMRG